MAVESPTSAEMSEFLRLETVDELAAFLGTTRRRLNYYLYSPRRPRPRQFHLRKRSSGTRLIQVPPGMQQVFLRKLLPFLTHAYRIKPSVYGFVLGGSVYKNAKRHVRPRLVLNFDLQDFFPSIHFGRVRGVFQNAPFDFPSPLASVLAQLLCVDGKLPQGACTSPALSNFICRGLDDDLHRLAKHYDLQYTRYADDITISTRDRVFPVEVVKHIDQITGGCRLGERLTEIVEKHDFRVNDGKTRLRRRSQRQEVTGLVVNQRVNVPRRFVENLRAKLHNWEAKGYSTANTRFLRDDSKNRAGSPPDIAKHIRGLLDYLGMVRGRDDPVFLRYWLQYARLASREKLSSAPLPCTVGGPAVRAQNVLKECIWAVIGLDSEGDQVSQGTAFCLQDSKFVTAAHVLEESEVATWKLVRAVPPFDEVTFTLSAIRKHPVADLAIVDPGVTVRALLKRGGSAVSIGESVLVCGFPNWSSTAEDVFSVDAVVTQTKTIKGVPFFAVDHPILGGSSGGPIFDNSGSVVGVVANGYKHQIVPNGAIYINALDAVPS